MSESVAAVVVTYNRKEMLRECLDSILKQSTPVDSLFIIDNHSTDGTTKLLQELSLIPALVEAVGEPYEIQSSVSSHSKPTCNIKFHYVRRQDNSGSAGGFYEGIKRAYEKGYDWIWCGDDDLVMADRDFIKQFQLRSLSIPKDVLALGCTQRWTDGTRFLMSQKYSTFRKSVVNVPYRQGAEFIETDLISFGGVFFRREAITLSGLPNPMFFISYDDAEYSARLRRSGRLFSDPTLEVNHRLVFLRGTRRGVFGNTVYETGHSWRKFYQKRNYYLTLLAFDDSLLTRLRIVSLFSRSVVYALVLQKRKKYAFSMELEAMKQALHGILQNAYKPDNPRK